MRPAVHLLDPRSMDRLARRAAGWLRRRGLVRGDRVAVVASNHPRLLALTHGALRSGIIPVLVDARLPARDRAEILQDAEPALVVEDPDRVPWDAAPADDLADVPLGRPMHYTSGTSGVPKGVHAGILSERDARAWIDDERELWAPDPDLLFLVASPLSHSAGHRAATAALLAGARVLLLERFDAAVVVRALSEEPVGGAFLVPTHLRRILLQGTPPRPRAVRRILHAGEPCHPSLKRRAMAWLPEGTLWEFYGSTEGQFTAISPEEWLERPGSVGRARRGRSLTIVDPDDAGIGTVFVSAPPFARWEYWRDPERTASAWRGGSFTAGDLGSVDPDGYLFLASRREDLIISGGENVYPAEVERILLEHPGIEEAAVVGIPDPEWGQRVCAVLATRPGPWSRRELGRWVRTRLEGVRRPKQLLVVGELPRTATGKIDRPALRDLLLRARPRDLIEP